MKINANKTKTMVIYFIAKIKIPLNPTQEGTIEKAFSSNFLTV